MQWNALSSACAACFSWPCNAKAGSWLPRCCLAWLVDSSCSCKAHGVLGSAYVPPAPPTVLLLIHPNGSSTHATYTHAHK